MVNQNNRRSWMYPPYPLSPIDRHCCSFFKSRVEKRCPRKSNNLCIACPGRRRTRSFFSRPRRDGFSGFPRRLCVNYRIGRVRCVRLILFTPHEFDSETVVSHSVSVATVRGNTTARVVSDRRSVRRGP